MKCCKKSCDVNALDSKNTTSEYAIDNQFIDKLGTLCSFLCIIHCVLLPLLTSTIGLGSIFEINDSFTSILENEAFHISFLLITIFLAIFTIKDPILREKYPKIVTIAQISTALAIIVLVQETFGTKDMPILSNESFHTTSIFLASLGIMSLHITRSWLCRD